MATTRKSTTSKASTKAAVLDETVETPEVSDKQVVNEGINRFIGATGLDGQKARYKAQRAIAYQAFIESIEAGDFEALVDRAIANADNLPAGWGLERTVAEVKAATAKPAAKAPAKSTAKAPAKAAAAKTTTTARRRPTR